MWALREAVAAEHDTLFQNDAASTVKVMTNRAGAWAPVVAWCALLFGLSSIPGAAIPEVSIPEFDKLVHGSLYLVLGGLAVRALLRTTSLRGVRAIATASLFASVFGVTDELHQLLTPRRTCDVRDALADTLGGILGAWLAATILRRGKSASAL
jgi:VanZ family protein